MCDFGAHGLQPRHVDVDRARTDRAAAGQRNVGAAEARDERAEHEDRGPHGLDELVRREVVLVVVGVDLDPHALVDVTLAPMRPSSSIIVVTSCRCGTLPIVTGPSASSAPARIGNVGVLCARDANFAVERHAAQDLQLVQATCSRQRGELAPGPACHRPG